MSKLLWKTCDRCLKKFRHLTSYKGFSYCKVCYNNLGEKMPHIPSKRLKCTSCGRERVVLHNVVMGICDACQVVMKEVEK